jgi:hypothetical protein
MIFYAGGSTGTVPSGSGLTVADSTPHGGGGAPHTNGAKVPDRMPARFERELALSRGPLERGLRDDPRRARAAVLRLHDVHANAHSSTRAPEVLLS